VTLPTHDPSWAFLQPDGKIVASGWVSDSRGNWNFTATRLNPDGSLDSSFGSGGTAQGNAGGSLGVESTYAVLQVDGKIVNTGFVKRASKPKYRYTYPRDFASVRFTANGQVDTTLDRSGKSVVQFAADEVATPTGALVQPWDQKLLVVGPAFIGGDIGGDPNVPRLGMARYNPSGGLDSTFGSGGYLTTAPLGEAANGVAAHQGKILVALTVASDQGVVLRRFNPNGSADTAWGTGGRVLTPVLPGMVSMQARRVVVQPDDEIVVYGIAHDVGGGDHVLLVRYNANGSLDTTFGGGAGYALSASLGGYPGPDRAGGLALQADGKIVVALGVKGWNPLTQAEEDHALLYRFNVDGTPDSSFDGDGLVDTLYRTSTRWYAVMVQPDGKIVTAGGYDDRNTGEDQRMLFARFNPDGSLDAGAALLAAQRNLGPELLGGSLRSSLVPAASLSDNSLDALHSADRRSAVPGSAAVGPIPGSTLRLNQDASGARQVSSRGSTATASGSTADVLFALFAAEGDTTWEGSNIFRPGR
jgi:uncharacterized delta-60 repeat protein